MKKSPSMANLDLLSDPLMLEIILSYHIVEPLQEFDCFGIFKCDSSRKVRFVFCNLSFESMTHYNDDYASLRKVKSGFCKYETKIANVIVNFRELRFLKVYADIFHRSFHPFCTISRGSILQNMKGLFLRKPPKNIQICEICKEKKCKHENHEKNEKNGTNGVKLRRKYSFCRKDFAKILEHVCFAKLEAVIMEVDIGIGASVRFSGVRMLAFRDDTSNSCGVDDNFFREHHFRSLERLNICENNIRGEKWKKLCNLKKLVLDNGKFGEEFFRAHEFGKLRYLEISNNGLVTGEKWGDMHALREIRLENLPKFGDGFFKSNKFDFLEGLHVRNCGALSGDGWGEMKRVKSIVIKSEKMVQFLDEFFGKQGFERLAVLKLEGLRGVNGRSWKMNGLREIELSNLGGGFSDEFFRNNTFEGLEILNLNTVSHLTANGWNKMLSLRIVEVLNCNSFEYRDFINQEFTKLEKLRLPKFNVKFSS